MVAKAASSRDGRDDAAILHPEREDDIAGVHVVMREYGFVEGMKLHAHIQPIVAGFADIALQGELADTEALQPVFGENAESVVVLVATACDQPQDWVRSLNDEDGRTLQLLWWAVNADFFTRRVMERLGVHQLKASAGLTSGKPSRAADTTHASSAATPAVN